MAETFCTASLAISPNRPVAMILPSDFDPAGVTSATMGKMRPENSLIEDEYKDKVEIIPVETLKDVLENVLVGSGKKRLLKKLESLQPSVVSKVDLESERATNKVPRRKKRSSSQQSTAGDAN